MLLILVDIPSSTDISSTSNGTSIVISGNSGTTDISK